MKKYLSALLALALCMSAALADGEPAANGTERTEPPEMQTSAPAQETAEPQEKISDGEAEPQPTEAPGTGDEPTAAPTDETPPEASGEPTSAPSSEPTNPPEGDLDASAEPTDAPQTDAPGESTEPTAAPTDPAQPQKPEGYAVRDGQRVEGKLEDLLAEEGKKTVYVLAKEPVEIEDFRLALLRDVELLPDPETYPGENYIVTLWNEERPVTAEDILAATEEILTLTIAVEEKQIEPGPSGDPGEVKLRVEAVNYTPDVWLGWSPEFQLSGIPANVQGYSYEAIVYDERFIPMSGDTYMPLEEGEYTVRFAILDAMGNVADASERYALMLDFTAPELMIALSDTQDYTMTLSASDARSGVADFTLDGGETWLPLNEGESVVHTEPNQKVFAPGMIQVRDLAGNVSANAEEVALIAIPKGGGWGGGGGGGGGTPAPPHSSGSGDDAPYASYELALPEGAVDVLTLGGEEIDLGLEIAGEESPEGDRGRFTAELTSWAQATPLAPEIRTPDTLVIRAETAADEAPYACTWRVNGAVLRKLYNTDIRYLALAAGDAVLSLPTVGFTAGTRYAELKMEGVSTAEFEYEIVMRIDPNAEAAPAAEGWNLAPDCKVEISVEVAGERFSMIDRSETPEMYPFDVYCGPADLPDYPYGAYPGTKVEG